MYLWTRSEHHQSWTGFLRSYCVEEHIEPFHPLMDGTHTHRDTVYSSTYSVQQGALFRTDIAKRIKHLNNKHFHKGYSDRKKYHFN